MPVSPEEKYWAAVEYTVPDFMAVEWRLLDAVVLQLPGGDLEQPAIAAIRSETEIRTQLIPSCVGPARCSSGSPSTTAGTLR